MKCGITTAIAIAETSTPCARRSPRPHARRRRTAYQIPMPATTSPTSSFVVIASAANTANGSSRSSSRYQNANSSNGHARATGWNSFSVSHSVAG